MRVFLLLATNLAVMLLLGVVLQVALPYFGLSTANTGGLLVMAAVFGMGGAFISLAMSKWMAKRSTGAQVITEPRTETERWLIDTVRRQADAAGIGMPEVAIYDAPDVNAFATGMNKNNALVAVSTGLLANMTRDEAEAVMGHEISHVANGDMVTLTLIQGVLNTFVIFLARIIGSVIDGAMRGGREGGGGIAYFAVVMVLQLIFGVLASMIVMWFSRRREFRADEGGATLAGRQKMIAALERLGLNQNQTALPKEVAAFGISGHVADGFKRLFMTHPPLTERIAALRQTV